MSRPAWAAGLLAAFAAGGIGYVAGHGGNPVPALVERAQTRFVHWFPGKANTAAPAAAKATGPVVYYRDPDGKPAYSLAPMATADGRDFLAVRAGEDVRFDEAEEAAPHTGHGAVAAADARKIHLYRNPMGLPDTSPVPRKDSMGMDYIPVYEGEDAGGEVVTISPGKVQRTGVRTEVVERRVVARPVRIPGTVALDERW